MLSLYSLFLLQCEHDSHYLVLSMTWSSPFVLRAGPRIRHTLIVSAGRPIPVWRLLSSPSMRSPIYFLRWEWPRLNNTHTGAHGDDHLDWEGSKPNQWPVLVGNGWPVKHIKVSHPSHHHSYTSAWRLNESCLICGVSMSSSSGILDPRSTGYRALLAIDMMHHQRELWEGKLKPNKEKVWFCQEWS